MIDALNFLGNRGLILFYRKFKKHLMVYYRVIICVNQDKLKPCEANLHKK